MGRSIFVDVLVIATLFGLFIAVLSYVGWEFNRIHRCGRRIIATITEISYGPENVDSEFSHDHPYVTARWTDPNTGHKYMFSQMATENKPFYKKGNLVSILIDPKHPNFYEMQI
jgi:hypothetical protein